MADKVFRPYAIGTVDTWLVFPVGSSKIIAADPGEPIAHNDNTNYIQHTGTTEQRFKWNTGFPEKMASVSQVIVYCYLDKRVTTANITLGMHTSAGDSYSSPIAAPANYGLVSATFTLDPNSDAWTEATLRDSATEFSVKTSAAGWVAVTSLWPAATYVPDVTETTFSREITSQMLRWGRIPVDILTGKFRLEALDIDVMRDFLFSHYMIPETTGDGAGRKKWERRAFRLLSTSLNPNTLEVDIQAKDLRRYLVQLWDTGVSPYTAQSGEAIPDGPARLDAGVTRTFTRASVANVEEEGGLIVQLSANKEKITPSGMLMEGKRLNYVKNSSFADSPYSNSWSLVGGATYSQATGKNLFHTDVVPGSLRLQGTGAGGDLYMWQTTFAWDYDSDGNLSIDHIDASGDALKIALRVNFGTVEWYDFATDTWGTGYASHTFGLGSATEWTTDSLGVNMYDAPVNNNTLSLFVYAHAVDHDVYFGHIQLEGHDISKLSGCRAATSRIISLSSAAVAREADVLTISNALGRRAFNNNHGTLFFRYKPNASRADYTDAAPATPNEIYFFDNLEGFKIWYAPEYGRFHFDQHLLGAIYYIDIVAGTEYDIVCRWGSDEGELGLGNYSVDIFVNGVKGTGYDGGTLQAVSDTSDLIVSKSRSATRTEEANGYISQIEISPFVLTDDEIKGLP